MATAEAQRKRRKKHKQFKRCLWCPRRAQKKKALCRRCGHRHRIQRAAAYRATRNPSAKQYRCTECGDLGHNARKHK